MSVGSNSGTASPSPTRTSTPRVEIPVATPIPGSIWVANPQDRTVLHIDTNQHKIVATIEIEGHPDTVVNGEGGIWVLDRENDQVLRIDPAKNAVVESLTLPTGDVNALAAGSGSLWVGMTGRLDFTNQTPQESAAMESASKEHMDMLPPGMVLRIDPKTHERIAEYSVQPVNRLAVNGFTLWVLSRGVIDTPLQVIDFANQMGMAVPFRNAPEWLPTDAIAVNDAGLWLFSTAYGQIFHATPDGRVLAAVKLEERQPTGYADLLLVGQELWAATPWGTVLRIDTQTNKILAQTELNIPLTELIAGSDAVWLLSQQTATLYRLDTQTAQVTNQISLGSKLEPTVVPSSTPRVVIWKPCPDAPNSRLKVGDLAYVTKDPPVPNRVRLEPRKGTEILGHISPGGSMEIIDGPQCADGWVWWKVRNANIEGWTAEGDAETYWLVPLFQ